MGGLARRWHLPRIRADDVQILNLLHTSSLSSPSSLFLFSSFPLFLHSSLFHHPPSSHLALSRIDTHCSGILFAFLSHGEHEGKLQA
jgi:hypothetical protein